MGSFTNRLILSHNAFQLRPLCFTNTKHPSTVINHLSNKRSKGGIQNKIPQARLEMHTSFEQLQQLQPLDLVDDHNEERIEILVKQIKDMFSSLGEGEVSPSAYDTAWMARIPDTDDASKLQFPTTLDWIMKNQLDDGSWGDGGLFCLYDRLVCTLSCVITLSLWKQGHELVANGVHFLQKHIQDLEHENSIGRTAGFEVVFPSMLNEARSLGLKLPYDLPYLKHLIMLGEQKKSRIPVEVMHSVPTTRLLSIEALQELVQWDRILKLQSANGSFLDCPSATAAAYLKIGDKKCHDPQNSESANW